MQTTKQEKTDKNLYAPFLFIADRQNEERQRVTESLVLLAVVSAGEI